MQHKLKRVFRMKRNKNELTVAEHFHELKCRVLQCVAVFVLAFAVCYYFAPTLTRYFLVIGKDAGFTLSYMEPQEMLLQSLRLCLIMAFIIALPVTLWNIIAFILPVFSTMQAKVMMVLSILVSLVLFALGIVFCLRVLFPFVFQYLYSYSQSFGINGYATVSSFLNLFITTACIIGVLFEMPLFSAVLTLIGIITSSGMRKGLKLAIVIIAIVSAIITPPDVVSMAIVGIPMIAIYIFSIGVSLVCEKIKKGE